MSLPGQSLAIDITEGVMLEAKTKTLATAAIGFSGKLQSKKSAF
jgi:hypothetical protein